MNLDNNLLLRTLNHEQVERPPIWLMRQAGRILPQYRALRGSLSGFKELVSTPQLAAEVTIQPVDELNVDAAIIFSDILVIPEAMGLDYEMVEKVGPSFPTTIKSLAQVEKLESGDNAAERLDYVYEAVRATKKGLNNRVPLIGFSGAPWTLLAYMVEGGGSKTFSKAKKMLYQEPEWSHLLLSKITDTIIAYLQNKIAAGVDVVQIFDSWAGLLSPAQYKTFALPYIEKIAASVKRVPVITFAKGAHHAIPEISEFETDAIGLDWTIDAAVVKGFIGDKKILQGNLDPCQLYAKHKEIEKSTIELVEKFGSKHIVNLGHGVYPDTPLDGVKTFVNTIKNYTYPTN